MNIEYENQEEIIIKQEQYIHLDTIKEKELECSICLYVISSTVAITECMHKFCSHCIHDYCKSTQNPTCPLCRTEIDIDSIILSQDLTNFLENSLVKCKNIECDETLTRSLYYDHVYTCQWNKLKCLDCCDLFYLSQKSNHLLNCRRKICKCDKCKIF